MSNKIRKDYYIKRKAKLMKNFNKHIIGVRKLLAGKFDDAKNDKILNQMRVEFENLIPEIPYIGGQKNSFTHLLLQSISTLAIFRILEKEGFTFRDIGKFFYEFSDKYNKFRKAGMEKRGKDPSQYPFETEYKNYAKVLAETSQKRIYPYDWVLDYVEGDGSSFDWGFNFHECGVQKVFKELGDEKYVPFLCLSDFSEANILGFGFSRTQTLSNGAPMCDHRWVKNFKTPRAWPPDNLPEFKKE